MLPVQKEWLSVSCFFLCVFLPTETSSNYNTKGYRKEITRAHLINRQIQQLKVKDGLVTRLFGKFSKAFGVTERVRN